MKKFSLYIVGLAQLVGAFALYHESRTDLAFRAEHSYTELHSLYEQRCTIDGVLSETCMDRSLRALAKDGVAGSGYVPTVKTEKKLYPALAKKLGVR